MAALIAVALASGTEGHAAGFPDPIARWASFIHEAAGRAAIPEVWVQRVIRAESAGRTMVGGHPITSRAGAMGLMQLMPATWTAMRARLGLGSDPFDPHDNIVAGATFLRMMYDRFGYPGLFGAYNAGPKRYGAFVRGRGLPAETVKYLATVTGGGGSPPAAPARHFEVSPPSLFVLRYAVTPPPSLSGTASNLFAIQHSAERTREASGAEEGGE